MQGKSCGISTKSLTGNTLDLRSLVMYSARRTLFLILLCSIGNAPTASTARQLLAGYWGQSLVHDNPEKPLKEVCQTTKYDILNVAFLHIFFDTTRNQDKNKNPKDSLPALNFAHHCTQQISKEIPTLLRCPGIEEGIKECQSRGKKVLISVGGPTGDGTLPSPSKAREFAKTLYDLFLGGDLRTNETSLRPFGSAVMDGVDLDIEGGRPDNYPYLIRELRRLMDSETGPAKKSYLITAAPDCAYPDHYLGPEKSGTALEEAGEFVDYLYVKFYNNDCHIGDPSFPAELKKWLSFAQSKVQPLVFLGLPAHTRAAFSPTHYKSPKELEVIYESKTTDFLSGKLKTEASLGGIMLWDVSWDQNNIIDGSRYSDHVFTLLKDTSIVRPNTKTPTQAPIQAGDTSPDQETSQVLFDCAYKQDGLYPNPSDCTKYYMCRGGTMYELTCPTGLLFNVESETCDWPQNVEC